MDIEKLAERCMVAESCLPDAPYRTQLCKLHQEMLDGLARLRAEVEALRVDVEICADLVQIVEGHFGAVHHGVWTDRAGLRLKDTKRWARFYVMAKKLDAAIDAGRGKDNG